MKEYGLSKAGFKAKDFLAIKEDLENNLKQEVDPSLRFSPDTVIGVLTGIIVNQTRQVWESLHALYSSLDPNSASGKSLDALCSLTGTYRRETKHSYVRAFVRLAANTTLTKGSMAALEYDKSARFKTLESIKNNSDKEALLEVMMIADEIGPIYAEATKLNQIITPEAGWLGITNTKDAILGRFAESDEDLRLRRFKELRAAGSSTFDGLISNLYAIDGVEAVHVEEGLHQFTAYVMGGEEQSICEALWKYKPLGVHTSGTISHLVKAQNNQEYLISFNRPVLIPVALHLNLKVKNILDDVELEKLKKEIIDYAHQNIKLGDEPYPSRIYGILFTEKKILDVMSIRLNPSVKEVKPFELVRFDAAQIFIEQVVEVAS